MDGGDDHVHLLVEYPPKVAVSSLVNSLKGVSSRLLRKERPDIEKRYWKGVLWSPFADFASIPAAVHRSPLCASSFLSNSSRHLFEQPTPRTAAQSALFFPGLKAKACRTPGQAWENEQTD